MELKSISRPNYFYIKDNRMYNRIKFQKHKLKDLLEIFDPNSSEMENVLANKYRVIYGCRNYKYKINLGD